jgi:hypothetical protein
MFLSGKDCTVKEGRAYRELRELSCVDSRNKKASRIFVLEAFLV